MQTTALILLLAAVCQADNAAPCKCSFCRQRASPARRAATDVCSHFVTRSHAPAVDAADLALHAEAMLRRLRATWLPEQSASSWTPRCELVVHTDRTTYERAIGLHGGATLGSTLVRFNDGKVVSRRIDLLADRADRPYETISHELVHVLFAERFPKQSPPRWAEEGAALLADTHSKQMAHRKDFAHAVRSGSAFKVNELVRMSDYPAPTRFPAFYGQSLVLVDFLMRLGEPQDFARFVDRSLAAGHDQALREVYGISSASQLDQLWNQRAVNTVLVAN